MKMVCPHCGLGGTADENLYGKKARCPECQKVFRVNDENIVEGQSGSSVVIEQSMIDDNSGPGEYDVPLGFDNSDEEQNSMDIENPGECSICRFSFSRNFITMVDDKPVCPACAG